MASSAMSSGTPSRTHAEGSRRTPNSRLWRDRDVRRVCKLAREQGIDPAVVEVDTARGIVRVSGRVAQAGNPWDVGVEKLNNKSSSNK